MRGRNWTVIAVTLIFVSFFGYAFLARKPLCIDSKLVEKIDRLSTTGTNSIYRCSLRKSVPYDESLDGISNDWHQRLVDLEHLLDGITPLQTRISVSILEKKTHLFKILDHEVIMSEDFVDKEGVLEKAILKIWFREGTSPTVLDHPLVEESATDLLYFILKGRMPVSPRASFGPAKWPFVIKTVGAYCLSDWHQLEYDQYCKEVAKKNPDPIGNLVASSLRPLLTESFVSAYLRLDLGERKAFLEKLREYFHELSFNEAGVGFSATEENKQSLIDLSAEISTIVRNFSKLESPGFAKWNRYVDLELGTRGFNEETMGARADLLVKLKGIKGAEFFANGRLGISEKSTAILMDDEKFYLLPNQEGIENTLIGPVMAQRILYLHCGPVKLSDLVGFADVSERLLAVESCDGKTSVDIEPYIQGHAEEFAKKNPDLRFVEIHIPSLVWAIKANRVKETQTLSLAGVSREMFRRQFGWRSSVFDEDLRFFRVEGEIDAIKSYRP